MQNTGYVLTSQPVRFEVSPKPHRQEVLTMGLTGRDVITSELGAVHDTLHNLGVEWAL